MENPSSKQNAVAQKVLSVSAPIIPTGYNKSIEGYNAWAEYIRQQVHSEFKPTTKQIQYQNLFKNVRRS